MSTLTFEMWAQMRLTSHGYSVGPIDGHFGALSRAALRKFQKARGLFVTGDLNSATVAALRASSSGIKPSVEKIVAPLRAEPVTTPAPGEWPRQQDVPAFYGPVGQRQTLLALPYPMKLAWDKRRIISRISVHEKVAASAGRVFESIAQTYSAADRMALGLDVFGGALNVRKMRGGSAYSMHSWGIAIDFDPERNQLKWGRDKARLAHADAEPFWRAWEAEGWLSLGRARNYDWMHVQAARL